MSSEATSRCFRREPAFNIEVLKPRADGYSGGNIITPTELFLPLNIIRCQKTTTSLSHRAGNTNTTTTTTTRNNKVLVVLWKKGNGCFRLLFRRTYCGLIFFTFEIHNSRSHSGFWGLKARENIDHVEKKKKCFLDSSTHPKQSSCSSFEITCFNENLYETALSVASPTNHGQNRGDSPRFVLLREKDVVSRTTGCTI